MNPIVQHQIYYSDNDGNNGEHAMIQKIVKELLNIDAIKSENSKGSQKDGTGNDSNSPGKNALLKKKTEFQTNNGSKIQKQAIDNSKNKTEGPQNTENSYSKDYSKKQSQKTILTWNKQDFKGYSIQLARIGYEYLTVGLICFRKAEAMTYHEEITVTHEDDEKLQAN
ncbi:hypothetical protein C0J52_19911 [Blattella germanica]|nr:hypothetical protein C0J52_19911 [Blattella germanica]